MANKERVEGVNTRELQREKLFTAIYGCTRSRLVRQAFRVVDRMDFVPKGSESLAYEDEIIQLAQEGSSISQPTLTAIMIDHLGLTGNEEVVLEIGTGSGYSAALLSKLAKKVHTVEYNQDLSYTAQKRLTNLGFQNIEVHQRDGVLGLPEKGPFDAIIVTAGLRSMPKCLIDQLKPDGAIVAPIGSDPIYQNLVVGLKTEKDVLVFPKGEVRFHALQSLQPGGWTEEEIKLAWQYKKAMILGARRVLGAVTEGEAIALLAENAGLTVSEFDFEKFVKGFKIPESGWVDFEKFRSNPEDFGNPYDQLTPEELEEIKLSAEKKLD